jgi:hypothetical protein
MRGDHESSHAVSCEHSRISAKTAPGIDYDPHGLLPTHPTHGQQWIVRKSRTDTNDDAVHQRPQSVQMSQARRPVYVFGMACFRGNTAIERLPDLTDNHEIIHRALL